MGISWRNPLTAIDWVLVDMYTSPNSIDRGDVILSWNPQDPKSKLVKRVIGLPGDTVLPRRVHSEPRHPVLLKASHLWLEGDNAVHSRDSNDMGPVSLGLMVGRVTHVLRWQGWWPTVLPVECKPDTARLLTQNSQCECEVCSSSDADALG